MVPDIIEPRVRIRLEFEWRLLGQVETDGDGRLVFPTAPRRPGLYRVRLGGAGPARHYVGEADELRRRFQHYRTPGRRQKTNIRMNSQFLDHLAAGGNIEVDIVVDRVLVVAGVESVDVELAAKAMRRLLEQAALVNEDAAGVILLNR